MLWIFPNSLVRINHTVYILPRVFSVQNYSLSLTLSLSLSLSLREDTWWNLFILSVWPFRTLKFVRLLVKPHILACCTTFTHQNYHKPPVYARGHIVSTIKLQKVCRHNYTSDLVEWMNEWVLWLSLIAMDGWVRVLRPFNSISVISRRWNPRPRDPKSGALTARSRGRFQERNGSTLKHTCITCFEYFRTVRSE